MKKIVIVDDDSGILEFFGYVFKKAGYEVVLLSNSKAVIGNLHQNADLFLVDYLLPGDDGVDVCIHLRSQKITKKTPIILITTSPVLARRNPNECSDLIFEKPFFLPDLLDNVQILISDRPDV